MSTPFWKLRRLAARCLRVLDRKKGTDPVFSAFEFGLRPVATNFISAFDEIGKAKATLKQEKDEGRTAVERLFTVTRAWLPLLKRDIPGFETMEFTSNKDVLDDILEDAVRLHGVVMDYAEGSSAPLPYAADCLSSLDTAINSAQKEITEAEQSDVTYQSLARSLREMATELEKQMVAFRRTLAVVSGRTDKDYQKLRLARVGTPDVDDDPAAPLPPVVEPANPGEGPNLP
ncbi:hypothetical protein KKF84_03825 [Myxococcota bacterium]|nr:hypothetical protein [Myxococcota bacterium]MBU1534422.1 hypothetical protein [Myxococcota bacterium]